MYMTSLMTSAKIGEYGLPAAVLPLAGLLVMTQSLHPYFEGVSMFWVQGSIRAGSVRLIRFLVAFLLVNLLVVCFVCQKHEGPIKSVKS